MNTQEETPRFLLIVRERLRPETEAAYDNNERQLVDVCVKWKCPHPYLALATVAGPQEVWAMLPLGTRKEEFRETFASTMTEHRRDLSGDSVLRIPGERTASGS